MLGDFSGHDIDSFFGDITLIALIYFPLEHSIFVFNCQHTCSTHLLCKTSSSPSGFLILVEPAQEPLSLFQW